MITLTPTMKIVLLNIAKGKGTDDHFPSYTGKLAGIRRQAHYGGLTRTLQGLRRRGLIDVDCELTPSGQRTVARLNGE